MRRLILTVAATALTAAALAAASSTAVPRLPAAHASGGAPPQLTAVSTADGSIHATWKVPANEKMEEFLYDPSSRQTPPGTFDSNGACQPMDSWCWQGNGTPLYCYYPLYHDRTGDCAGHFDLGDKQASLDTDPLPVGHTYYVQVSAMDQCVGESSPCDWPYEYYSNVVKVTITKSKSGGKGGSGSGASGSSGKASGTAKVSFTKTVTVTRADGSTAQVKSTVLVPGDVVHSLGSPTHLSVNGGALVLDRNGALAFKGDEEAAAVWQLQSGEAYYKGATGRKIRNLLDGGFTETWVCCNAAAVVSVGPAGDTVAVVSPGVEAPATGPVLVMAKGSSTVGTPLAVGEEITVRGTTAAAFPRPRRFVPTRFFWK